MKAARTAFRWKDVRLERGDIALDLLRPGAVGPVEITVFLPPSVTGSGLFSPS
jgi:hypothetical protein